jgi:hypothetical protein
MRSWVYLYNDVLYIRASIFTVFGGRIEFPSSRFDVFAQCQNVPDKRSMKDVSHYATRENVSWIAHRLPRNVPALSQPPAPQGCKFNFSFNPKNDDDDTTSRDLTWPLSLHCSSAGLTAVPSPLPSSLLYM